MCPGIGHERIKDMESFFIRLGTGSPVEDSIGASKADAYMRFLINRTENAKHGLVMVSPSYGSPSIRLLDKQRNAWPVCYHELDFIHTQTEHGEWNAENN